MDGTPASQATEAPDEVAFVAEWRAQPLAAGAARQDVGGDCTRSGSDECVSGRCIHVPGAPRGQGYVCTSECRQDSECPQGWACVTLAPGAQAALCQPPRSAQGPEVRP